jgi:DNA-binding Lrp family transcriptional regulator
MMMIHDPWSFAIGGAAEMRAQAELLDKVKTTLVNVYTKRTGIERAQVEAMMSAETWMTADEMVKLGFADESVERFEEQPKTQAAAKARIAATLRCFQSVPRQLLSDYRQELVAAQATKEKQPMNKIQILALLGLAADASDDTITATVEALKAPPSLRDMVPRADLDAVKGQLAVATAKLEEQKAEAEKREAEQLAADTKAAVDAAVASGKVPPASKDYHLRVAGKSREALQDFIDYISAAAPIIEPKSQLEGKKLPDDAPATEDEETVAKNLNLSVEELRASRKDSITHADIYGAA